MQSTNEGVEEKAEEIDGETWANKTEEREKKNEEEVKEGE